MSTTTFKQYDESSLIRSKLIEQLPGMVIYVGDDMRYRYVSESYASMYDMVPSMIIGCRVEDINFQMYPKVQDKMQAVLAGQKQVFELNYVNPKGVRRWFECTYIPDKSAEGDIAGFFAYLLDIHDRKEIELGLTHFRSACDQAMEGFALQDQIGNFVYINDAHAEAYGYTVEEMLGKNWREFYGKQEVTKIEAKVFPLLEKDGNWSGELKAQRKSGQFFDVDVSMRLISDSDGNTGGAVINCRNITERKLAERSLRQLQRMEALGQLTGGVAHDFNNLLAIIVGNLEVLSDHFDNNKEAQTLIDRATKASERGASLTARLLAFARKQPLRPKVVDIKQLLNDSGETLIRVLGEQVSVQIHHNSALPLCKVDTSQFENALLDLGLNARDAMNGAGLVTIKTGVEQNEEGDKFVSISVCDKGCGMPNHVQERMFDPFFTTKDASKGNGLGLSMVHGFVTQSGGYIDVISDEEQGTSVVMFFPVTQEKLRRDETLQPNPKFGKGNTIFLIEDQLELREILTTMLEAMGFGVIVASDADSVSELLASKALFDIVLSDVVLPGEANGPELVEQIKQVHPQVRVVYMSGFVDGQLECNDEDEFMTKPITRKVLAQTMNRVLKSAA
ncbi:MAG: PAS domain S-box protein [Pseudomonadota bacterium]